MRTVRALPLLLALFASAHAAAAAVISIADARSQPLGTVVTVEGSVTVPSGDFASSTFDQGFGIQDATAGVYVSTSENPNLNFNRLVRVTGKVADDGFGVLVLRPASLADVETLGGASLVEPAPVATGAVGEATEGSLVEITGTVTRPVGNDLPFGYSVFVDDGSGEVQIFIAASTGVNPFNIPFIEVGAQITAVGQSGQFLTQFEVLPRFRGDLHVAVP
jgi:hypothetical protein